MASRIDYSQNRRLYVGTTAEVNVADNNAVILGSLGIGTTLPGALLQVGDTPTSSSQQGARIYGYDGALNLYTKRAENTFNAALYLYNNPVGEPGTGTGILFRARTSTTDGQVQATVYSNWTTNTHATRTAKLVFQTCNTGTVSDKMTILGNGNVGINATSPKVKLQIYGNAMPETGDAASVEDLFTLYRNGSASVWSGGASLALGRYSTGGGSAPKSRLDFKLKAATGSNTALPEVTVMTMLSNGNVGIGTDLPDDKLDVVDGNAQMVFGTASSDRTYMRFKHNAVPLDGEELCLMDFSGYNDASQNTRYVILTTKAEDVTDGSEDGSLTLLTMKDGTPTATLIARSGKVAIGGTVAPSQALDVTGKIRATDDIQLDQTSPRIDFDNGATGSLRFFSTSASATRMSITSGGEVTLNAYDSTNQVGTPTYLLGTDSSGNVVKTVTGATTGTQVHSLAATGGTASWKKIGTFTANPGGQSVSIKIVTNNGYNSSIAQNVEAYIRFKTSNGSSVDSNGFSGDSSFYTHGPNNAFPAGNIKWVSDAAGTSAASYALYALIPSYSGNGGFYVVENSVGTWVNNMTNSTDPGAASSTVLIPAEQFRVGSTDLVVNGGGGDAYFANSKVGIGLTSPNTTLSVQGTSSNGINVIGVGTTATRCYLGLNAANKGYLFIAGSSGENPAVITSQGNSYISTNLGIGETSPDQKLNVREDGGGDTFRGIEVHNNNQSQARAGICFKAYDWVQSAIWHGRGTSAAYNGALVLGTNPNTTDLTVSGVTGRMWILNNGYVGIGDSSPSYSLDVAGTIRATGDIIAYSDERVKENIKTINNSLEKVSKLRGVEFNKIGNNEKSIGVIAQEIEKVIPEVVREDEKGMKSVAYGNISGLLIEAIKELKAEIEELKLNKCNCNCNK